MLLGPQMKKHQTGKRIIVCFRLYSANWFAYQHLFV